MVEDDSDGDRGQPAGHAPDPRREDRGGHQHDVAGVGIDDLVQARLDRDSEPRDEDAREDRLVRRETHVACPIERVPRPLGWTRAGYRHLIHQPRTSIDVLESMDHIPCHPSARRPVVDGGRRG